MWARQPDWVDWISKQVGGVGLKDAQCGQARPDQGYDMSRAGPVTTADRTSTHGHGWLARLGLATLA